MLRFFSLTLMLMFLLTACDSTEKNTSTREPSINVVDTMRILHESDPGKAGMEFVGKIQDEIQAEFSGLQARLQAEPENMELQQEIQMVYNFLQQRIQAERQNAMSILNDHVIRTLKDYREKNNVLLIVSSESALAYDKSVDITDAIIVELNKQKVEYKSVIPVKPEDTNSDEDTKSEDTKSDNEQGDTSAKPDSAVESNVNADEKKSTETKESEGQSGTAQPDASTEPENKEEKVSE